MTATTRAAVKNRAICDLYSDVEPGPDMHLQGWETLRVMAMRHPGEQQGMRAVSRTPGENGYFTVTFVRRDLSHDLPALPED